MNKSLHIVCFDAPAPPDYGGAIDMYYTIQALAETGATLTLHYFDYKEGRNEGALKAYCKHIFSYERKSFSQLLTFSKPHIVASRINKLLIERLNADDHPILLEGIHCTGLIPQLKNKTRKIVVRLHNDEAVYYRHLARAEANLFKRAYYAIESLLLLHYQKTLPSFVSYAALSQRDNERFGECYGLKHVFFVPAFLPWQEVTSLTGSGNYCLYHGNLTIAENEAAAQWLIETVFSKIEVPLVIAGRNPSRRLMNDAKKFQNISFRADPTDAILTALIEQAHIHVLPDLNATGVKLKLLHALFKGRFCITHSRELQPSSTLAIAQTPEQYMGFLKSFMRRPFTAAAIAERKETLRLYNNTVNAEILSAHLW